MKESEGDLFHGKYFSQMWCWPKLLKVYPQWATYPPSSWQEFLFDLQLTTGVRGSGQWVQGSSCLSLSWVGIRTSASSMNIYTGSGDKLQVSVSAQRAPHRQSHQTRLFNRTLKTSLPRSTQECLQAHFRGYRTQCYWLDGIVFVGVPRTPFLCCTAVCLLLSSQEDSTVLSRWTQFCFEWAPSSQNSRTLANRETRRVMKLTFHGEDSFYPCNVISMIHFGLIITGS